MMSGVGSVFPYQNQGANPLIDNPKLARRYCWIIFCF